MKIFGIVAVLLIVALLAAACRGGSTPQPSFFVTLTSPSPTTTTEDYLKGVDLIAEVRGATDGPLTYIFDCTGEGLPEAIPEVRDTRVRMIDLCFYPAPGTYTARVQVVQGNHSATGTLSIVVKP